MVTKDTKSILKYGPIADSGGGGSICFTLRAKLSADCDAMADRRHKPAGILETLLLHSL